jgi:hypothetical protein
VIASSKIFCDLQQCRRGLANRFAIVFNYLRIQYIVLMRNAQEKPCSAEHSKMEYLTDDSHSAIMALMPMQARR